MKAIILLVALVFAGCNAVDSRVNSQTNNANRAPSAPSTSTAPSAPSASSEAQVNDGVKRMTTAELEELMKQGKVVVVDVRNQAMFDAGHIRGAKLIPLGQVSTRAKELPKDKQIVTYCS